MASVGSRGSDDVGGHPGLEALLLTFAGGGGSHSLQLVHVMIHVTGNSDLWCVIDGHVMVCITMREMLWCV